MTVFLAAFLGALVMTSLVACTVAALWRCIERVEDTPRDEAAAWLELNGHEEEARRLRYTTTLS